jgi:hypothetical protein
MRIRPVCDELLNADAQTDEQTKRYGEVNSSVSIFLTSLKAVVDLNMTAELDRL